MYCSVCGTPLQGTFCPACAARAQTAGQIGPATDVGLRVGAYLIDVIPAFIAGLIFGWIPIVGAMILGVVLGAYWLLRDIGGASIGKMLVGLVVVKKDGSPSVTSERILRNVPLCVGPALLMIPLMGYALAPPIAAILGLTEIILLLVKHERLGDMLAGTTVIKKTQVSMVRPV